MIVQPTPALPFFPACALPRLPESLLQNKGAPVLEMSPRSCVGNWRRPSYVALCATLGCWVKGIRQTGATNSEQRSSSPCSGPGKEENMEKESIFLHCFLCILKWTYLWSRPH